MVADEAFWDALYPEVTMHTYPLAEYMRHVDAGRWDDAGQLLLASANILVHAGAELLICPDNTLHQALDIRAAVAGPVAPHCRGSRYARGATAFQAPRHSRYTLPDGRPGLSGEAQECRCRP